MNRVLFGGAFALVLPSRLPFRCLKVLLDAAKHAEQRVIFFGREPFQRDPEHGEGRRDR
jgi:hypothetical protein